MTVLTLSISSNGSPIRPEIQILAVQTHRALNKVPSARLSFLDGDVPNRNFPLSDSSTFALGAEVEIKARWEGNSDASGRDVSIFKGLVVRHALEARNIGCLLHVELKDKAIKLTRGRKSAVRQDMTDSDAFKRLIGDAGLTAGTLDATPYTHKSLVQYQSTDWDFMLTRAQALGLQVVVHDGTVSVRAPTLSAAPKLRVEFGLGEVYDWDFELDGQEQVTGLDTLGWDPSSHAMLSASAVAQAAPEQGTLKGAAAAHALGLAKRNLHNGAAFEAPELKGWADGQLTQSRLAMLRGRVSLQGTAAAALLDLVEISGMGQRFNGKALVSGVAHRIEAGEWRTDLQLGLDPASLIAGDAASVAPAGALLPAVSGLQIGIVAAIADDPDQALRVQLQLPALGQDAGPVWARWASPDAGVARGMVFWPEVGDEVVVGFFNDDPRAPVVLGSLFSTKQMPPAPYDKPEAKNLTRGFFTKSGCEIGFIDDANPKLFLRTKGKREIMLDDDAKLIKISDPDGNTLTLDAQGITFKTDKDFKVDAGGKVEIKGDKIDLQ